MDLLNSIFCEYRARDGRLCGEPAQSVLYGRKRCSRHAPTPEQRARWKAEAKRDALRNGKEIE